MSKILFNDKLIIKTVKDEKITEYNCDFYQNYIDAETRLRSKEEWKHSGEGAQFMGVSEDFSQTTDIAAHIDSLTFDDDENNIIYSVTVGDLSGILRKNLSAEKDSEGHIIHSRELSFQGASLNRNHSAFVTCIKENYYNSHVSIFDLNTDDYTTVTYGDCYDFDAIYSNLSDNRILFATKGAGRNADGEFVKYSQSSIMEYNLSTNEINEILDGECSYCKPKDDKQGNLYYIKRPSDKEDKRSIFKILLDIILIPWRLLEAIYRFLEFFTIRYTGKQFIKDGSNPAKRQNKTEKDIFIEGNLINAENEYKNNLRHKDAFAGYAPRSWELIKRSTDGNETTLLKGVIDYCFTSNGEIIYTNGKHVLCLKQNGEITKIADATLCTKVAYID